MGEGWVYSAGEGEVRLNKKGGKENGREEDGEREKGKSQGQERESHRNGVHGKRTEKVEGKESGQIECKCESSVRSHRTHPLTDII